MSAKNIKKITSFLFSLRILKLLISLLTVTYTAKYFGVSIEKDVWLLVSVTLTSIWQFFWGPINETFRAKFIFIKEKDSERNAIKYSASLISFISTVTIMIIFLMIIYCSYIAKFMAADLTKSGIILYGTLLIMMLPSILLTELNNISTSILNAYDIFYIPELVGSFSGLAYLGIIVWLSPLIGIYALAIGQYFNLIVLMTVLLLYLKRLNKFTYNDFFNIKLAYIKPFIIYALPFFFPYAIGQLSGLSERWLAGMLGIGNISILDYSRQFTNILQGVLSGILTTVMIPLLSKEFAQKDIIKFNSVFIEHISVIYLIMALTLPMLFGASQPLCQFLFFRGNVTMGNIQTISFLCRLFSIAFLGIMLYLIFGYSLLASEKGKIYAIVGVGCQIGILAFNLGLMTLIGLICVPIVVGFIHLTAGVIMWKKSIFWNFATFIKIGRYHLIILVISSILYLFDSSIHIENVLIKLILEGLFLSFFVVILSPLFDINLFKILFKNKF